MSDIKVVDRANLAVNTANLVLNAVQVEQLSAANATLGQLANIEAERERRAKAEDQLRQFVFDQESQVQQTVPLLDRQPKHALYAALVIRNNLSSVGVDPSRFREFADKDRTRAVIQQAQDLQLQAQNRLSPEAAASVKTAFRLAQERPALEKLIGSLQAEEKLAATADLFKRLDAADTRQSFIILGAAILALVVGGALTNLNTTPVPCIASAVIWLLFASLFLRPWRPDEHGKLKVERTALQKLVLPEADRSRLLTMFPQRSSAAAYLALLSERDLQIEQLLG